MGRSARIPGQIRGNLHRLTAAMAAAAMLLTAGCAQQSLPTVPAAQAARSEAPPAQAACPTGLPADARCWRGTDSAGAPYLIAMPQSWNGVLVVHAHGGPALGAPDPKRADNDARRWAITVRAGYAWIGSVYRQGGVALTSASEDTERARQIFVAHIAQPRRTLLHGMSWGAGVAAKLAERVAPPGGESPYDAVVLTNGVLGAGTRSYDFRLDLRVVYQVLCGNHPRPDEPQYPLWMGLPENSALSRADLAARADECLGLRKPPAQRSAEQARKLDTLTKVVRIPERTVLEHLNWATWHFQDIAFKRTGGLNAFENREVRYTGSPDDAALNARVARYAADPRAQAIFDKDAGLSGRIGIPVLTAHAIHDPIAFVELEAAFRQTMARGGSADRLVQTFLDSPDHSILADAETATLFDAALRWAEHGEKPTPAGIAQRCETLRTRFGSHCRFLPDYQPAPLSSRSPPR